MDIEGDGDFDIVETGFGRRGFWSMTAGQFSAGTMPEVNPTTRYFGSAWADMDNDDLDIVANADDGGARDKEFIPERQTC